MNRVREFLPIATVILTALFLIAVKWPHLALPCFVDEGFPYAHAIHYLHDHELTLMPSGMPALLSTGHPTLFYFLAASWMRIFGTGMFAAHFFPLVISIGCLFAIFRFGKTFFNAENGALAVLLFGTRAIFIAQSSQLLPETLVTLFTILALHSWLQNKKWLYVLWASLLVLTKESGLVLPAALCLWELISFFRYRQISIPGLFKSHFHTALPFVAAILFFIVQRIQMGWFFFPRHIGFISVDGEVILNKLTTYMGAQLFVFAGGILTTLVVVIATIIFFIRKMSLSSVQRRFIGVMLLFMICFIAFSSLNYYCPRYILCLYPFWFIIAAFIILEALKGIPKFIPVSIIVVIAFTQCWYTFNFKTNTDDNLGYVDVVKTQKEAIQWCVKNGYRDKDIFTLHQMERAMMSDAGGFIEADEIFTSVSNQATPQTFLFIFSCNESDQAEDEVLKLPLRIIIRFQSGKAWTEICTLEK